MFYKITINEAGRREEMHDTKVSLKKRVSPIHYGSEQIILPLHLVSHSSQLGEITEIMYIFFYKVCNILHSP